MSNKHYNGSEPIVMSADEYDRQADLWKESGGNIRDDHPHTGADYPHSHWYDGDNQNEDFVCVREESTEADIETEEEPEPDEEDE